MIDIHNHALNEVDDGSSCLEESLKMLQDAYKEGIEKVIITPHYIRDNSYNLKAEEIKKRFKKLKKAVKDDNNPIELFIGNELRINKYLDDLLADEEVLTLAGTKYVLVEFPFTTYSDDYDEYLYNIKIRGYKIIIAHPERYAYVQKDLHFINRWQEYNCYYQLNQDSFFKHNTRKTALKFVEEGLASIIASDGHNYDRPITLKKCYEFIERKFSKQTAEILFDINPKLVIEDQELKEIERCKKHLF